MLKSKQFLTVILTIFLTSCSASTPKSSTLEKQLEVPDIKDVKMLEYTYYTSAFENGFGGRESIFPDSNVSSFYDKLKDAEFVEKLESNEMIDSENVVITIYKTDDTKRVITVYPEDDVYYLEDNDNSDLYTCDESIFSEIKTNAEINKQYFKTEE